MFGNVAHHALIQSLEQGHPFLETFAEVDFAVHSSFCDGFHLIAHTGPYGQFVDDLCFNKRGIHIKANQTAHTAVHIVLLEREVHAQ